MKTHPATRTSAVELTPEEFRSVGHRLVDQMADFLASLPSRRVTSGESPAEIRAAVGASRALPDSGADPARLVSDAVDTLAGHSLFNGHPRFFGYITSSAAPIGAFGDFIAAVLNCNVGAWKLAPAATEIEVQTIRWIAEFIGYPADAAGLLVSGGNMANFVGFLAARTAGLGAGLRETGVRSMAKQPRCYCSADTHTWIQKAADLSGLGTDCIRWIRCDSRGRMDVSILRECIERDTDAGDEPFLVVGTAGSVGTGAVDPLPELADLCRERKLWFHVDGAYGGVAAKVPGTPTDLMGLALADSVAVDPHKWLYAPLEAGCALVRNASDLQNAFSYHPAYYNFDAEAINFFDWGPQNSRGFRALKVWLAFQQAGREGYVQTIADDINLAEHAFRLFGTHPEFEAVSRNLSICTFRYVPPALRASIESEEGMLNAINQELLTRIERSGDAFLSNAVVDGRYLLRLCIVNFRTSVADIERLPELIANLGRSTFAEMHQCSAG
jgi:glutamate/tyrosine decarboxylase-like PLP-dependent enzyme